MDLFSASGVAKGGFGVRAWKWVLDLVVSTSLAAVTARSAAWTVEKGIMFRFRLEILTLCR